MRKITTNHASATIPNDDDTIKNEVNVYAQEARANDDTDDDDTDDNGVCAEQVPVPSMLQTK